MKLKLSTCAAVFFLKMLTGVCLVTRPVVVQTNDGIHYPTQSQYTIVFLPTKESHAILCIDATAAAAEAGRG